MTCPSSVGARRAIGRLWTQLDGLGDPVHENTTRIGGDVGGLPRPDLPQGAHRDLVDRLHELHHRAGWPSLRAIASEVGCSPTTVSQVFSSARLPSWGALQLVVEYLAGDAATFRDLWVAAGTPEADPVPVVARLAGRREELRTLRTFLGRERPGLLVVAGEAGIGKTRLVGAAAESVTDETFVAVGSCLPLATEVPLLPVANVLRAAFHIDGGQWLKEALADCAPYVPGALKRILPEVDLLITTPPEPEDAWSRQRLFAAVGTTLAALSMQRPLALVVEDLHWADSATLDLLDHLLTAAPRPAVPIVGTYRTEDPTTSESTSAWFVRVRQLVGVATVELGPLSRDETREQIELLVPSRPDIDVVDRIHRRAQGNPLFTEQLAAQPEGQPIPALLADLLDQRLRGIGPVGWSVGRTLAIADQPLTGGKLCEITGLHEESLIAGVRELAGLRLLRCVSHQDGVELRHALLAEAIRRRLVPGEAMGEHRRLATAMAGWGEAASPAQIATHWQSAESPSDELRWRVRAAREAGGRYAAAQEAEQWRRALTLWQLVANPATVTEMGLADVYGAAVDALDHAGDAPSAAALAMEALSGVDECDDMTRAGLFRRAGRLQGIVDPVSGLELMDEAIRRYERLPASREYVTALRQQASVLRHQAKYREADAIIERALKISIELSDPVLQRLMLGLKAWGDMEAGRTDVAGAEIEAAQAITVEGPDPYGDITLGVIHSDMLLKTAGAVEEIEAVSRRGLGSAALWGVNDFSATVLRANLTQALTRAGQVSRAADLIVGVRGSEPSLDTSVLHREQAHIDMMRGQLDDAAGRFGRVAVLPITAIQERAEIARDAADCSLWRGDPRAAFAGLVSILGDAVLTTYARHTGDVFAFAARAAADLVQMTDEAGRDAERARLLDELRSLRSVAVEDPFGRRAVPADAAAWGATWLAELTRLGGSSSVDRWSEAARAWDALTRPFEAAYCRWRTAEAILRAGQNGSASAKVLRRAARDAREHLPLLAAIRAQR